MQFPNIAISNLEITKLSQCAQHSALLVRCATWMARAFCDSIGDATEVTVAYRHAELGAALVAAGFVAASRRLANKPPCAHTAV